MRTNVSIGKNLFSVTKKCQILLGSIFFEHDFMPGFGIDLVKLA